MIKEEKFITTQDGTKLYSQIKEVGGQVWIVAVHGLGEHSGRHQYVPKQFGSDFNILQFDLRGHGRSQGKRGYIQNFETFYYDLKDVLSYLQKTYGMLRFVLLGHSMGALISAGYVQDVATDELYPELLILSAPPIRVPGVFGSLFRWAPRMLTDQMADCPLSVAMGGTVDLRNLSHDGRVYDEMIRDEFVVMKPHSKLLFGILQHGQKVFTRPLQLRCPGYCVYGTADHVIDAEAIEHYFTHIEKGVMLKAFDGAYHEIHNEIDKYKHEYFKFLQTIFEDLIYDEEQVQLQPSLITS